MQPFRTLAKKERPAVAKDLNSFLDKYDKRSLSNSSFQSKPTSPAKATQRESKQNPPSKSRITTASRIPSSNKKKSMERTHTQQSLMETDIRATTVTGNFFIPKQNAVQGT